tara:strand:+ start:268 stop:576 length:309 start_codon:yes stop_codon:yes gene_type:complete
MKKYTQKELKDIDNILTPIKKETYETVIERYNPTSDMIGKGGVVGKMAIMAAMMGSIPIQKIEHKVLSGVKKTSHIKALKRINNHLGRAGVDKYIESKTQVV